MHPGSDPMGAPPSFAARRPHAQQLGNFELPPPPMHKYPYGSGAGSQSSQAPTTIASVGNLLTPPNTNHSEVMSSSGAPTSTAQYPTTMANGQYIYSPPSQGSATHYGYPPAHHQQPNQYGQSRGGMLIAPFDLDQQLGQ